MDVLLLNDTTLVPFLPAHWRVLSVGPEALYVMPDQNHFDIWLPNQLEHALDEVLVRCREKIPDFEPQVIIQFETSLNYFYRGIERSPALTIWRLIDTHMFYHWQPLYAHLFDVALVAQKDYLPRFEEVRGAGGHPEAHWLPLNTNKKIHYDRGLPRELPVSFVGSMNPVVHPERVMFFEALKRKVPLQIFSGKNQVELAEIYNHSQVVVNECLHRDLNYRLFEALSNGAVCVTPAIEAGQRDLFINSEDIVEYKDKDVNDAAAQILALLQDPSRLERIRQSGRDKVHGLHDISHRAQTVVELIQLQLRAHPPPRTRKLEARKLLPIFSLLTEFTFELKRVGGRHMEDLVLQARALDERQTALYLISLSRRWLERQNLAAADYCLQHVLAMTALEPALRHAALVVRAQLESLRQQLGGGTP
ncbi:MAG: glycosyltransferase [Myxococcota bacterium]